jgi:hypothetical protein
MLVMRWAGSKDWALRGPLGVAAKLTVDEHNGTFAKWKPFSRSAGGRDAEKTLLESSAEKAGEQSPLAST